MMRLQAEWRCVECGCTDGRQAIGPKGIHERCNAIDGAGVFVHWFKDDHVEIKRTSGTMVCEWCGNTYFKHPWAYGPAVVDADNNPFLHVICTSKKGTFGPVWLAKL